MEEQGNIIIIDSDIPRAETLQELFEQEGCLAETAADIDAASALCHQLDFDIVIAVPREEADAFETYRQLKRIAPRLMCVILATDPSIEQAKRATAEHGICAYLAWPDDKDALVEHVNSALQASRHYRELRDGESRYRRIIAAMTSYMYTVQMDGGLPTLSEHSPGCLPVTGYSPKAFRDRPLLAYEIVHPGDREYVKLRTSMVIAGQNVPPFEYRIVHRNGSVRWVRTSHVIHRERDGSVNRYDALVEDITERKQAEIALAERLRYEKGLSRCSGALLTDSPDAILEALRHLLNAAGACRASLFENFEDPESGLCMRRAYTTSRTDLMIPVARAQTGRVPYSPDFDRWRQVLSSGNPLRGAVNEFPESERPELRRQGIRSLAAIPMKVRGVWYGFIGLDDCRRGHSWNDEDIQLLQTAGDMICAFLERKMSEQELRQSEINYRAIFDSVNYAIFIHDSHNGRILETNQKMSEMYGYTLAEARECSVEDLSEGTSPYSMREAAEFMANAREGRPQVFEWMARRKDDSLFWTKVDLKRMYLGGKVRVMAIVEDISARKAAEKESAQLSSAVEQATECIVITDTNGKIQYVNPAFEKITGYSRAEVLDKTPRVLKSGKHDQVFYEKLWDTLMRGQVWTGRIINRRKDGDLFPEEATITPLRDASGRIVNYVAVKRDVTQETLMESQLQQAAKMEAVGQLAAGIAHEINTPTQYVGDNTRFLEDSYASVIELLDKYDALKRAISEGADTTVLVKQIDRLTTDFDLPYLREEIPRAIDQSLEGVDRVAKIVNAMRNFSHPGLIDKTPTDMNAAIENTITVARNEWKYAADLTTDLDASIPLVTCLPGDINQVFLNLIVNAAQAIADAQKEDAGRRGKIHISTRPDGDSVEIRIRDNGTGIPEKVRQYIFDPFFTTKEVGRGTGQGLSIAHTVITTKHNGTIRFETAPGEGTTFIVRLPVSPTK